MVLTKMTGCKLCQMTVLSKWTENSCSCLLLQKLEISAVPTATWLRQTFSCNCLEFDQSFSTLSLTVIFGSYSGFVFNWVFLLVFFFQKSPIRNDKGTKPRKTKRRIPAQPSKTGLTGILSVKTFLLFASVLLNVYFIVLFTEWPVRILHSLWKSFQR